MRARPLLRHIFSLLLMAIPTVLAQSLPDLGDSAQAAFTPAQERALGRSIMREVRRDPSYYDDA